MDNVRERAKERKRGQYGDTTEKMVREGPRGRGVWVRERPRGRCVCV